jgi:hypothetical protein
MIRHCYYLMVMVMMGSILCKIRGLWLWMMMMMATIATRNDIFFDVIFFCARMHLAIIGFGRSNPAAELARHPINREKNAVEYRISLFPALSKTSAEAASSHFYIEGENMPTESRK